MPEELSKQMEGESASPKDGLSHLHQSKGPDSSSRNSLSSGTSGSLLNKPSSNRADCYWFAQSGDCFTENSNDSENSKERERLLIDREERLRVIREKQAEERLRKLEELKASANLAQKYREQQEEERRRRIEEIKFKENERRHLVEERKRLIFDAEMDRRESLVRRSQDREARIEAQRNAHRTSIGFAFGSSTPRLLDSDSSFSFNSRRTASQVLLYHPSPSSQARSSASSTISNGNSTKDTEGVVRRRICTGNSVDRGMEPVNAAHRHTIHESFFYGVPESSKSFSAINNPIAKSSVAFDETVHVRHSGFPWEVAEHQNVYTTNSDDNRMSGLLHGSGVLVGDIMTQSFTSVSTYNRGRRRTDLIPTIPIHKDNPRTRSPGRAYSMTRLDQLSQSRGKRPLQALREEERMTKTKSMANLSGGKRRGLRASTQCVDPRMSKSTSHLAVTPIIPHQRSQRIPLSARASPTRTSLSTSGSTSPGRSGREVSPGADMKSIKRLSQSMWQLSSTGGPRPTKTSILRRDALAANNQPGLSRSMLQSKNLGSQVNGGDVGGNKSSRAASSPSRPQSSMSQQSLSSNSNSSVSLRPKPPLRKSRPLSVSGSTPERNNTEQRQGGMPPTGRPPRAKSAGPDNVLKEVIHENGSPTPPVPATRRHPTPKANNVNCTNDKPKIAPKPNLQKQSSKTTTPLSSPTREPASPTNDIKIESIKDELIEVVNHVHDDKDESNSAVNSLTNGHGNNYEEVINGLKETNNEEAKVEECATIIPPKPKITTEEEAKAMLAEKRRQAREQAEREAELERQRQEELKRLEEERLRREEEEQRLWEEEVERQRKAEEERLQKAIEEQQKKEEEERLRKEEEAKLKIEREKAEQLAREEQERLRKEAEEKFAREEEERAKRRKRVEDIMSRTRARDKAKKELEGEAQSPTQNEDLTNSFTESFIINSEISQDVDDVPVNNKEQEESCVITNGQKNGLESPEESLLELSTIHNNGFNNHHQFHMNIEKDYSHTGGESIINSQCLSGFDVMTPAKILNNSTSNYLSTNSPNNISNMGDHLSNEDNVNFNIMTSSNGIINYPNHLDTGVTDLLS